MHAEAWLRSVTTTLSSNAESYSGGKHAELGQMCCHWCPRAKGTGRANEVDGRYWMRHKESVQGCSAAFMPDFGLRMLSFVVCCLVRGSTCEISQAPVLSQSSEGNAIVHSDKQPKNGHTMGCRQEAA